MKLNNDLEYKISLDRLQDIPEDERTMINFGGIPNYLMQYKDRTYVLRTDNQVEPAEEFYELLNKYSER